MECSEFRQVILSFMRYFIFIFQFQGLKIRKQRSTGDLDRKGVMGSIRSTGSTSSWMSSESNYAGASVMSEGSQASFVVEVKSSGS